ncbi:hypothetical protein ACFO4E_22685 [Nocardiopsis mangrovi]|uniref:Flp pilus-assembly TadG-like N-terminal domain-containing protein n=1 Tax=Nocardiopsis mangrovi TaxID=1179818 RepID=A0ABV9E369_9ACTN
MLRRIHDPERGAGFTEYGAVILLVAAITAAVIAGGTSGRVQEFIASAVDSVGDGTAGGGDGEGTGDGDGGDPGERVVPASEEGDGGGTEGGPPAEEPEGDEGDGDDEAAGGDEGDGGGTEGDDGDDGGGGFWGSVGDTFSDIGSGIANAGTDAWDGAVDGWNGLVDNAERLWDDPGQWASDTWGSFTDGLSGTWDQVTSDPVGWVGDVLFSETVQENWANGNYWEAGSQAVVENAVAFIPFVGWVKKGERIADIADGNGDDRGGDDGDGDGDRNEQDENETDAPDRTTENENSDPDDFADACPVGSNFVRGAEIRPAFEGAGTAGGLEPASDGETRESSCPEWLRELRDAGNQFNSDREPYYTARGGANEVHVGERTAGNQYQRVDSYIPGEEIVSRKYTQLSEVQEGTAIGYLRELSNHYGPGTEIADTPSNRRDLGDDAVGEGLEGQMYLEVPAQTNAVPDSVLREAERLNIIIRDENGRVWDPPEPEDGD